MTHLLWGVTSLEAWYKTSERIKISYCLATLFKRVRQFLEHYILVPQVIFKTGFALYYLLIIQADTWGENLFKSNAIYPFWC